ncbi:uncharacterized protein CLUP02_05972 [Colletotrichum lupini]|uniref:Uncharacterized protein n=1 Tax=Colletotrichum lupini TaxID=145971 RepID=A0A9Q8SN84_9PEZI|nr:uncharacterized protein CLUP02_05972 [Colletotrichum lupini]UQC80489.1 hypothetical protein CLUP02_05972 [Colletotrichum lupini]
MAVAGSGGYGSAVTLPCQTDSLNAKSFSLQILRYPGPRASHTTPSLLSTFPATLTITTSTNTSTNIITNANLTPGFAS